MNLSRAFLIADSETLGKYDDAILLSAGFTLGTYEDLQNDKDLATLRAEGLSLKFDVAEQVRLGRKTTPSVVDWWKSQSPEARAVLFPSDKDTSVLEFNTTLQRWIESKGYTWQQIDLWDRNCFDWRKFAHLYENQLGFARVPWNYTKVYDLVQWFCAYGENRYMNIRPEEVPGLIYHNCLDDALLDRIRLAKFFKGDGS